MADEPCFAKVHIINEPPIPCGLSNNVLTEAQFIEKLINSSAKGA